MRRAIGCLAILMLGERVVLAQVTVIPRDRPTILSTGTAVIAGHVIDAQTGRAIARARVRLNSMNARVAAQPLLTDSEGAFTFRDLPAGSFFVSAEKSTYLPGRFPDAGRTLRATRASLTIADGEKSGDVVIRMQHGGAITGHIVDAAGDPVEFVQIQVLRLPRWGGKLQPRGGTSSDDLGQFRIPRLEAGRYLLLATPRRNFAPMDSSDQHIEAEPIPTFYPGVADIGQATPIAVARGTTVSDVEIQILEGQVAVVNGTLLDSSGRPVTTGASISIRPLMKNVTQGGMMGGSGTGVRPDGTFQVRVPPGDYELEGRLFGGGFGPARPEQVGIARLSVTADMSGVTIQLGSGATISGRLMFEGSRPAPTASTNPSFAVILVSPEGDICRSNRTEVKEDWTFAVEGIIGTCVPQVGGGLGVWFVKSITYRGENLLDRPTTFAPGQEMRGVEVVMSDERSDVKLSVTDERGLPTREYVALLFPTNRANWTPMGSSAIRPFIPMAEAGREPASSAAPGSTALPPSPDRGPAAEVIRSVPAGDYYIAALDDADTDGFRDPAFLEQLSRAATRVRISGRAPSEVQLRRLKLTAADPRP